MMTGDRIRQSVSRREIALLVSADELGRRAERNPVARPAARRGYQKLFLQSVTQADHGVDFDFLRAEEMRGTVPKAD
jgi:dihydroxy-acid dehydratase